jgi:hypothetical protein
MVKRCAVILAALILSACSKEPHDIKFGPNPPDDMEKHAEILKKLGPQELILLNSYVVVHGESLKKQSIPNPATGKTVGEALQDAKVWQEANSATATAERARLEEEKRRADKENAERKYLRDKVAGMLVVSFGKRTILPSHQDISPGQTAIQLEYDLKNTGGAPIIALKGNVVYKDAKGATIMEHPFQYDKTIPTGTQARVVIIYPVSEAWKEMQRFSTAADGTFSFTFWPDTVIIQGGETFTLGGATK